MSLANTLGIHPYLSSTIMESASSQKSKPKHGPKSRTPSGGQDRAEVENIVAKQKGKRGRRKVSNNKKSTQVVDNDVVASNVSQENNCLPLEMHSVSS